MGNGGTKSMDIAQMMGEKQELSHYTLSRIWVLCSQKDHLKAKDFLEILRKIEQASKIHNLQAADTYFKANRRKRTGWKLSRTEFFSLSSPYVLLAFPGSVLEPQTPRIESSQRFDEDVAESFGETFSERGGESGIEVEVVVGETSEETVGERNSQTSEGVGESVGGDEWEDKGKERDQEGDGDEEFLPAEGGDFDFDFDNFQDEGGDDRLEMLRQSLGDMSLRDDDFFDQPLEASGALYCSFGEDGYDEQPPESEENSPPFVLLETREVYEELTKKAKDAGEIFNLSSSTAIQVLSRIQWNVGLIAEAESMEGFLRQQGASIDPPPRLKLQDGPFCETCFFEPENEEELAELFALGCGHVSCMECWQVNIGTKLEAYAPNQIECPVLECDLCLLEEHVGLLGGKGQLKRYKDQMIEMYIHKNQRLLHCPNPACSLIIEYKGHGARTEQVYCKCGGIFCFNCITEKISTEGKGHFPATCQEYKGWAFRQEGGSKPSRARPCPKCDALIIKCGCDYGVVVCADMDYCPNQACNHMSCPMCAYDFCWICMEEWNKHGTSWYSCQFVDQDLVDNQTFLGNFRMFGLKYDDFEKNAKSYASRLVLLREILGDSNRLQELAALWKGGNTDSSSSSSSCSSSSSSASFFESPKELLLKVAEAYEELSFCYHVLKNTFIIQYFLKDPDADIPPHFEGKSVIDLFAYKQKELENYTQMLSNQVEEKYKKSLLSEWKQITFGLKEADKVLSLVKTMRNYRLNLFVE